MKLIVRLFFEYGGDNKKVATKMFIYSIHETIIWEADSNVFSDAIIKSIINKYNDIDKKKEAGLVTSLSIRCDKINIPKGSS